MRDREKKKNRENKREEREERNTKRKRKPIFFFKNPQNLNVTA